jgi:purine-binding chemotaxis protein CheW
LPPFQRSQAIIKGLLNPRGEIMPTYDISIRFNMDNATYIAVTVIIVITLQSAPRQKTIGLVVKRVRGVVNFRAEDIRKAPELGSGVKKEFIEDLVWIHSRNVMLLDSDQLYSEQELQAAS